MAQTALTETVRPAHNEDQYCISMKSYGEKGLAVHQQAALSRRVQWDAGQIADLARDLEAIRADMLVLEEDGTSYVQEAHERHRESTRNLLHYLALRDHDIRGLQDRLAPLGLSSLGRTESHVLATIVAVLGVLRRMQDTEELPVRQVPALGFAEGRALLAEHARALLGGTLPNRHVRIMVTMPSTAAEEYGLVRDLLAGGMNIMRINCAHDDPEVWARMIANLRRAEEELGRTGAVAMDLAGPKLRTGPMEPGPAVLKWRPTRDPYGWVLAPARIWLAPLDACLSRPARRMPVCRWIPRGSRGWSQAAGCASWTPAAPTVPCAWWRLSGTEAGPSATKRPTWPLAPCCV